MFVRPSIDAFEGEPGLSPDLRLLHLHPTLLNPRWPKDSMRTLTLTLPLLNPFASRDSRVDVVSVCGDPPRPLHLQSNSAWPREMRQGTTQAVKPRSDASDSEPGSSPDLHLHPTLQPRKNDDSKRTPTPTLPPLNPDALRVPQQDADGVCGALNGPLHLQSDSACQCELSQGTKQAVNPRGDAFDGEPGPSLDLHLHPTLQPLQNDDSTMAPTPTLPLLNPLALCVSQQVVDDVCGALPGPLLSKSKNARKRAVNQARKRADKQRRESDPDLFLDGLEDDLVLGGALLVADAFAVYSWSPERRLWIPVRVQVMMVDASNHCGWDPGRDFWRSLRLSDEAPFESA